MSCLQPGGRLTCPRRSGHLCNEVVGSLAAINPMNQQITGTPGVPMMIFARHLSPDLTLSTSINN